MSLAVEFVGKRLVIKVTPVTLLRGVLEEACRQLSINPSHHTLRYNRKPVDLTCQFRLSSIPSMAKLELVRVESSEGASSSSPLAAAPAQTSPDSPPSLPVNAPAPTLSPNVVSAGASIPPIVAPSTVAHVSPPDSVLGAPAPSISLVAGQPSPSPVFPWEEPGVDEWKARSLSLLPSAPELRDGSDWAPSPGEVTAADMSLLAAMAKQRVAHDQQQSVLKTKAMRDKELQAQEEEVAKRFPRCFIRLRFPGGQELVLQAASKEIAAPLLTRAVTFALKAPLPFQLRTSPPPTPLPPSATFLKCGLVPYSLVHVTFLEPLTSQDLFSPHVPLRTALELPNLQQTSNQEPVRSPDAPMPQALSLEAEADLREQRRREAVEKTLAGDAEERKAELAGWKGEVREQVSKAPAWFRTPQQKAQKR